MVGVPRNHGESGGCTGQGGGYFTKADSGEKILLTVYQDRTTREYVLGDTDFRNSPIEALYNIEVKHNAKGNAKLVTATPVN